ncbi:MAG TPA: NAD(P)/FAD-dependent oxidoreductase [Ktedonobacterales bacterium]|nr:NAD(P)/FAD-dependent oxidoreductase [Ktedonobacterales bacterium]
MQIEKSVVIVGGGPAGLSAAEAVARQGVDVVVLERQGEIGAPIHTSGGSFIGDLKALGIPDRLYHPVGTAIFLSPNREAAFHYPEPVVCILDVRGLYQYLAERAIAAGAQIELKTVAQTPILEDGKMVGLTVKDRLGNNVQYRARVVIDASGFSSIIATRAGLHKNFERYGYGAEYDLYAPNYDQDRVYLIMGSKIAPSGYAWLFPRGNGRVRVGVGVIRPDADSEDARVYLDEIAQRVPQLAPMLASASPVEYHTGLFPSEAPPEKMILPGLVATGDAAMQGSTLVGEGIRYAIGAGRIAGRVVGEAVKAGDWSPKALSRYEDEWRDTYLRDLKIAYQINQRIARFTDRQWDKGLDLLKALTPAQAALLLKGDFSPKIFFNLVTRNPSLVRTFMKYSLQALLPGKEAKADQQPASVAPTPEGA